MINKIITYILDYIKSLISFSNTVHPIINNNNNNILPEHAYITHFNMHRHFRYIYEKKPKKIKALLMSMFLLKGAKDAFNKLNLPNNYYVLCVHYVDSKGGDTQLFITGTVEKYEQEDTSRTAIAELMEEARFVTDKVTFVDKYEDNRNVFETYAAKISDLTSIKLPEMRQEDKITDGKKRKITCIVYGTKAEMKRAVSNIKRSSSNKINDDIDGLAFIPVGEVNNIIATAEQQQMQNKDINNQFKPFMYSFADHKKI